jgi:hypothetical protein
MVANPKLYMVFLLSFPRARYLYRTESLRRPVRPAMVVVLGGNSKRNAVYCSY